MSFLFGTSRNGLAIVGHRFGYAEDFARTSSPTQKRKHILILGGVHGDESEGVVLANALLNELLAPSPRHELRSFNFQLTLIPIFNPDGLLANSRGNAHGVDLNRNLPTRDWSPGATTARYQPGPAPASEPENKSLVEFIEKESPDFIISLHSWKPMLNINEPTGSSKCRLIAEAIANSTGDVIEPTIGYSTPGCLGTYAGFERNIPTITYEIERGMKHADVVIRHLPALFAGLHQYSLILK
jgi:protein MpaA